MCVHMDNEPWYEKMVWGNEKEWLSTFGLRIFNLSFLMNLKSQLLEYPFFFSIRTCLVNMTYVMLIFPSYCEDNVLVEIWNLLAGWRNFMWKREKPSLSQQMHWNSLTRTSLVMHMKKSDMIIFTLTLVFTFLVSTDSSPLSRFPLRKNYLTALKAVSNDLAATQRQDE